MAILAAATGLALVLAAALWCVVTSGSGGASGGLPSAHEPNAVPGADGVATRRDDDPEGHVLLPSARSLGLRDWQPTEDRRKDWTVLHVVGAETEAASVAADRPDLHFLDGGPDEEAGLSGLIDPADGEAISAVLLLGTVRSVRLSAAPPTPQLRSISGMAAAAAALVGVEPSATALLSPSAPQDVRRRLETAAARWPASARVWRVIAAPKHAGNPGDLSVELENEPGEFEEDLRRLREVGPLAFESIGGGLITARASLPYQNPDRQDRTLAVKFAYDPGSRRWVLLHIGSLPSSADMRRLADAGEWDAIDGSTHGIELLQALPDSLVTNDGLLRDQGK